MSNINDLALLADMLNVNPMHVKHAYELMPIDIKQLLDFIHLIEMVESNRVLLSAPINA